MIEFKHVLCPIDLSDTSIRALTYAVAFATWYEAQLEILHVLPGFEHAALLQPPRASTASARGAGRDAVETEVRGAIESVVPTGINPAIVVEEGRAHEVIAQRARAQPADLLVMGTHGRSGFNRLLLGSVTEKVLRAVHCPVLTVPPGAPAVRAPAVAFTRILCAIDYSPSAREALRYALELGRQANGRVTVLYALEYMDAEEPCEHVDFDIRQHRQHFIDHARARLHAHLEKESKTRVEIQEMVAIDRAYKAVLQHATSAGADLIVMGAQGTGGVELMLYGSNTQHVVRAAPCPVLTVHA
jgi:nucleotide-binding universal stress UspA family protein